MRRALIPFVLPLLLAVAGCGTAEEPTNEATNTESFVADDFILFLGTTATGDRDLYRIQADGSALTNLTATLDALDAGWTIHPDYAFTPSPDGQRILFLLQDTQDPGSIDLYEMEAETGTARRLAGLPPIINQIRYAPNSDTILVETRMDNGQESAIYRLDDASLTLLAPNIGSITLDGFFPQGDAALVQVESGEVHQLGRLDLDTGAFVSAADTTGMDVREPQVSPDGQAIIFQGWTPEQRCSDIFWVNVPAVDSDTVTAPVEDASMPMPMGLSQQAWNTVYGGEIGAPGDHQPGDPGDMDDAPPDDAEPSVPDPTAPCLPVSYPSFNPTGSKQITFLATASADTGRADVFISQEDGSVMSPSLILGLDLDPGVTSAPKWSPTGEATLFSFTEEDATTGGEETQLFWGAATEAADAEITGSMTPGYVGNPTQAHWKSDGSQVLFWAQGESLDAVVADVESGTLFAPTADLDLEILHPLWLNANTLFY